MVVCLGTPLFVRFPGSGFFRDPRVNDWAEIGKSDALNIARKTLGDQDMIANYNFTGAGEASAAFLLARLLSTRKKDLRLTRSSIVSWQQIIDEDVVFVGPPKFNLQLQATAMKQDIVITPDGIRNLKPRPGEPEFLQDHFEVGKSSEGETHALISRTPGLSGVGELLVIAGNASPDTFAAAEWITQPQQRARTREAPEDPVGRDPQVFSSRHQSRLQAGHPGGKLLRLPPLGLSTTDRRGPTDPAPPRPAVHRPPEIPATPRRPSKRARSCRSRPPP